MKNYDPIEILIVEDNPADSELMIRSLKKQGLVNEVCLVEDGQAALDFIFCEGEYAHKNKNKIPKVVFLDLKLPKISGLEVLAAIKSHPDKKKIPVVVVTSSKEDPDIKAAYELGANSYVVKPVNFDDFVASIQEIGLFWLVLNQPPV